MGLGVRRDIVAETGTELLPGAAIGGSFGAMLLIGGMTSFYGPLIPYLETRYGISRATAGAVLGADFGVRWPECCGRPGPYGGCRTGSTCFSPSAP